MTSSTREPAGDNLAGHYSMNADDIRAKIAERDRLAEQLRQADADLMAMGRVFWEAQGCKAFPRVDALRRAVSL